MEEPNNYDMWAEDVIEIKEEEYCSSVDVIKVEIDFDEDSYEDNKNDFTSEIGNNIIVQKCVSKPTIIESQKVVTISPVQEIYSVIKEQIKCVVCKKQFVGNISYKKHFKTIHGFEEYCLPKWDQAAFGCDECSCDTCIAKYVNDIPYECEKCKRKLRGIHQIKAHLQSDHYVRLSKSNVTEIQQARYDELFGTKSDDTETFQCKTCKETFDRPICYKVHRAIHVNYKKPFVCQVCDRIFYGPRCLEKHILAEHGHKDYGLGNMKNKHSKEIEDKYIKIAPAKSKPDSSRNSNYNNSEVVNVAPKKPVKCLICNKRFAHFKNLQAHVSEHNRL